jgi:gliding motility-associated-like protein
MSFFQLKLLAAILFSFCTNIVVSQDIGILSSSSPNSGCELANNELVTVVLYNFSGAYSGSFDVSYEINGGIPVTETITLSPFPTTSSYSYTFTTPADLSTANTYNFKFYTNLVGDVNNSNDTLNNITVVSDTFSIGGVVATSQSVCLGINNGTLNLNSSIGNVQFWESSITNGATWNNIVNTTNSQNYNNITQETWYRAIVLNGFCPQDTSSVAILSIDSLSVGGSIAGSTTVCVPPNNGLLTLSGESGSILDWEYSANGGGTWNSLSNTSNTYNFINQPSTYLYRALVKSGNCQTEFSDTALVTVLAGATGGTLSPSSQSVCSGINSGNITLSGQTGNISSWESSINGGVSWLPIANITTIQPFLNLTQETWYRAILTDCNSDTSSIAIVLVDTNPIGGTLSSDTTVCSGMNSGTINLSGETGTIVDWESSTNGGVSWSLLGNTTTSFNYNNITATTMIRVIVGSGSCAQVFSDTVTITVDDVPNAGTITAPLNVCVSGNNDSLVTTGVVGSIFDWEFSINGGISWNSTGNTTSTNAFNNLPQTTLYQVIASNGVCPNDTSQFLITVDSATNVGTLFMDDTVCYLSSGLIYLNGYQGSIVDWEESTDNGLNWNSLGIFTDTLNYANISNQIIYKAIVKSGVCPSDTSNTATLNIYPFNYGASNDTTIDLGTSATISAYGGLIYSWSPITSLSTPSNATTVATPSTNTIYTVSIIDTFGCVYVEYVTVNVTVSTSDIVIADLITANGDGFNDIWNIMGIESFSDTKVFVFNTSGNMVFESQDYQNDWDGTWNGNQLPDGTYYYIVEIVGESDVRKGFVTILSE